MRRATQDPPRKKRPDGPVEPWSLEAILERARIGCAIRYGPQPPYESTHAEWERFRALTERTP